MMEFPWTWRPCSGPPAGNGSPSRASRVNYLQPAILHWRSSCWKLVRSGESLVSSRQQPGVGRLAVTFCPSCIRPVAPAGDQWWRSVRVRPAAGQSGVVAALDQVRDLGAVVTESRHAARLPHCHEPPEATSLFVILIPIIAGRVLHATRARCADRKPNFVRRSFVAHSLSNLWIAPGSPGCTPDPQTQR